MHIYIILRLVQDDNHDDKPDPDDDDNDDDDDGDDETYACEYVQHTEKKTV